MTNLLKSLFFRVKKSVLDVFLTCAVRFCMGLCFVVLSNYATAQSTSPSEPADTSQKIKVEYSELGEFFNVNGMESQKLKYKVRLRHDSTVVYCDSALIKENKAVLVGQVLFIQSDSTAAFADSAHYNADTKLANLFGNVALEDGDQTLFTEVLNYDMEKKIATYHQGATISNGKSQIESQHGYYYTEDKQVFFKENVLVTDPDFTLRTDTMMYQTEVETVHFLAPTLITKPNSKIYTESGFYNLATGVAEFDKNPQFIKDEQKGTAQKMRYFNTNKTFELYGDAQIQENDELILADTILYSDETGKAFLLGNAEYKDGTQTIESPRIEYDSKMKNYTVIGRSTVSDPPNILVADYIDFNEDLGNGTATGDVVFTDTSANTEIRSATLNYNKKTDYVYAFGGAFGLLRPIMKNVIDGDTLFLCADTLVSFQEVIADSVRTILAYEDVQIFKSDFQGHCDSLTYSTSDSVFHFFSFNPVSKPPILWADGSQFSGDTIRMRLKNQQMDRLWLIQNAIVLNTEDSYYFNQIKGRQTTAYFIDNEIDHMLTDGNAEAVYYAIDDKRKYIGVNQTKCSRMRFEFEKNEVSGIRFYTEPTGSFSPIKRGDAPILLPGFNWDEKRKPMRSTIGFPSVNL